MHAYMYMEDNYKHKPSDLAHFHQAKPADQLLKK